MARAIAFARSIKASRLFESQFARVAAEWCQTMAGLPDAETLPELACHVRHVDGTFRAKARDALLAWLREAESGRECRILTNARCLSEGVDVPALDAVLFLHPRKSQIDVVQAVGRVMRRAPGKARGYVILPVAVAPGIEPADALDANEPYRIIWQVLNALRSHDERLDGAINRMAHGDTAGGRIHIEIMTDTLPRRPEKTPETIDIGNGSPPDDDDLAPPERPEGEQYAFQFDEWARAIRAAIVKRCGTRTYWEDWAKDVAEIAQKHILRIRAAVKSADGPAAEAFRSFLAELRDDLNDGLTEEEAIEMLAQHLVTRPVFEALFEGYSFAAHNPVSRALQRVVEALEGEHIEKEASGLEGFYDSVRRRAAGVETAEAKQKIIVELYDKFFRAAFPRLTQRLGIVYTPVELVDFILRSVDEVLKAEFGRSLADEGVHIIDPFVGTGTFLVRLIELGLLPPEALRRKYEEELHANEIVLLAYYIAAINIEAAFHTAAGGDYQPFPGICLTDTFELWEQERDLFSDLMAENSDRRQRQKEVPLKVIIANPPYSVGQDNANDAAANRKYPKLDQRIRETYAARSTARNLNSLYDSYIRAIRWASDRVAEGGVIGFVTNAGWVDGNTADGLRRTLAEEFSSIHVFHLRGNARTSGERRRQEAGNAFGEGTRAPICILILARNPSALEQGRIFFHDIGDYLSREEKLARVKALESVMGMAAQGLWQRITPNEHADWIGQRDERFARLTPLGDKEGVEEPLFEIYSAGVKTQRDAWAWNASRDELERNMERMIGFYGEELARFDAAVPRAERKRREALVDAFVSKDSKRISWTRALRNDLVRGKTHAFEPSAPTPGLYRPFTPQWLYYSRAMNEMVYQMPRLFPPGRPECGNRVIALPSPGNVTPFSCLMAERLIDLSYVAAKSGSQCFPRWLWEEERDAWGKPVRDAQGRPRLVRRDAITDAGLAHFEAAYPGEPISKDDLFHYVYGLLHSPDYRARYAANLSKELPRIPRVKRVGDFRAFAEAGRKLAELHLGFEAVEPWPVTIAEGSLDLAVIDDPVRFFRVEKMRFAGKRPNLDRTTIIYNPNITVTGIPLEAYGYVVNGKPAIEWVMERQGVSTDSASGITNDANRYAIETKNNPRYPLDLLCRVITVSMRTVEIVKGLPRLEIGE